MPEAKKKSLAVLTDEFRTILETNERWMLVGMLTIYKYQTYDEQQSLDTKLNNGVGFSGADGNVMSRLVKWLLKQTNEAAIRKNEHIKLTDHFDDWAVNIIRKKMPRYAMQLAKISRGDIKPSDAYD